MSDAELEVFDREALNNARRRALYREAGRQFAQHGYRGVSLDDIAKVLKLTKSGLFYYVNTKEELLYQCYADAILSAEESMAEAEKIDGNALDKLSHYIHKQLSNFDQPGGYYVILTEMHVLTPEHQAELRKRAKRVDDRMVKIVKGGIAEGTIATSNPRLAVLAIEGALNWIPKWYSAQGSVGIKQVSEFFSEFFANGLRTR